MKGLELSRAYFEAYGRALLEETFAPYRDRLAAGLVGEGSECFGYDDVLSQDHDFGPGFCIWIPQELAPEIGASLQAAYDRLPRAFQGYVRRETPQGGGRIGVMTVEGFYEKFIGTDGVPADAMQWLRIPESYLATAVNGAVFCDPCGRFTAIRQGLRAFYPVDVVKKKLAARLAVMAQSGQYNYPRCMERGRFDAAYLACAEFVRTALSAVYLLNSAYMPFYKWAFRGAEDLPLLQDCVQGLRALLPLADTAENRARKQADIEQVCAGIAAELRRRGWSSAQDDFLQAHGESVMAGIRDQRLASLHIMADSR